MLIIENNHSDSVKPGRLVLSRKRTLSVMLGWWARARFLPRGELRAAAVWRTAVTDNES